MIYEVNHEILNAINSLTLMSDQDRIFLTISI